MTDWTARPALTPPEWAHLGICADYGDADTWFPKYVAEERHAKSLCRTCPVIAACLTWALENDEYGVWGATTRTERDEMKRAS